MKRTIACGAAALLLAVASPAMAGLAKDSPMRVADCVPFDAASLGRLKVLRDKVRAEFARRGGPNAKDHWASKWQPAWVVTDDWKPIVGDEGIIGLESPSKNMAALIPSAWAQSSTGTKAGGYDPVADVEAAHAAIVPWAAGVVFEAVFFHPGDWDVRVSSSSKLGEGRTPMARFYFESGPPDLWISVWPLAAPHESPRWSDAYVGQAAQGGSSVIGSDTVSAYDRTCQVSYLERETWKDPETGKSAYQAEAVLGCVPTGVAVGTPEDLLVVLKTAEYRTAGAPDPAALEPYTVARRSFCTITMPSGPLKR